MKNFIKFWEETKNYNNNNNNNNLHLSNLSLNYLEYLLPLMCLI